MRMMMMRMMMRMMVMMMVMMMICTSKDWGCVYSVVTRRLHEMREDSV
jgi:hypothetical protein